MLQCSFVEESKPRAINILTFTTFPTIYNISTIYNVSLPVMATPFLQANSVSKTYPGNPASGIQKTDLTISPGKITAIIGESGSGKSTLLKLLYGLLSPDSGEVLFKGERIWGPEEKLIPGHDAMKMVTQHTDDLNLFANVWDNLASMLPHTDLKSRP